jgi:hypothetical protein
MKRLLGLVLLLAAMPSLADGNLFLPIPDSAAADLPKASQDRLSILKGRKTTKDLKLYNVNPAALSGDTTTMALGDAPPVVASMRSFEADPKNPKNFIWSGTLQEVPGDATFVVRDNKITGTIRNGEDLYRVESLGTNIHAIVEVDSSKFPPEEPPPKPAKAKPQADQKDANPQTTTLGTPTVDLLVAYTPAAAAAVSDIEALIDLALKESNDSYTNSGINLKVSMVSSFRHNYQESAVDYYKLLDDFASNKDIGKKRDASGADLTVLIVDKSDYCGMATGIGSTAQTGFAIVHYDCATGYYSFAHELGHLMGARHDPAADPATQPHPYAHGYQYVGPTRRWRTIMAYNCSPSCPRIQYWSNPNKTYDGVPMGVANVSDNSRMLNASAPSIAQFRKLPAGDITAAKK